MNMMMILGGAILGLAAGVLVASFLPARVRLGDALEHAFPTKQSYVESSLSDRRRRVGEWGWKRLDGLPVLGKAPDEDLQLLDRSPIDHFYAKVLNAVMLGLCGVALTAVLAISGLPASLGAISILLLAVVGWKLPDVSVKQQAAAARSEYTRAIGAFVEVVASDRIRNQSVTEAVTRATGVSQQWIFVQMATALEKGRYENREVWESLDDLGARIKVPALQDAARTLALSGSKGAAAYDTLRSQGQNLRRSLLAQENEEANKKTDKFQIFITAMAVGFVALILTPMLINI